ncbi:MAG: PTS sugar transporter subunit IIC [Elusimicrobiota bacterium]|nr:PTS sugar transporter subunit IIC [Elusimicrobiota bacterium]
MTILMGFELIKIAFVGGLISLDSTVFGQFMISRPIVAGPVIGWLCGDVKTGLLIGAMIELLWIGVVPVGVGVPLDSAIVCIVATALAANKVQDAAAIAIIFSVPLGIIFKRLDIAHRKWNRVFLPVIENGIKSGRYYILTFVIWLGVFLSYIKSFLFLFICICLFNITLAYILPFVISTPALVKGLQVFMFALPILGLASFLSSFTK